MAGNKAGHYSGPALSDADKNTIKNWIDAGVDE